MHGRVGIGARVESAVKGIVFRAGVGFAVI